MMPRIFIFYFFRLKSLQLSEREREREVLKRLSLNKAVHGNSLGSFMCIIYGLCGTGRDGDAWFLCLVLK